MTTVTGDRGQLGDRDGLAKPLPVTTVTSDRGVAWQKPSRVTGGSPETRVAWQKTLPVTTVTGDRGGGLETRVGLAESPPSDQGDHGGQ